MCLLCRYVISLVSLLILLFLLFQRWWCWLPFSIYRDWFVWLWFRVCFCFSFFRSIQKIVNYSFVCDCMYWNRPWLNLCSAATNFIANKIIVFRIASDWTTIISFYFPRCALLVFSFFSLFCYLFIYTCTWVVCPYTPIASNNQHYTLERHFYLSLNLLISCCINICIR